MNKLPNRLPWLKSGLFWRTFFMLGFLITVSMAAWFASFRMVERTPVAQQTAAQVVSVVTITRAALTHSAPELRQELLFDLMNNEGIRIYPLESTDRIELPPEDSLISTMQGIVRSKLGNDTKFASKVNDTAGFWVSFKIADDDEYWLMLEKKRIERISGMQWLGWLSLMLVLSLVVAAFISGLINQPLAQLAFAARSMAKGQQPDALPETGASEIVEANRSFNQMMQDLQRVESDRAVILAGISHDLRTPLARMQLEIEMANLSDQEREGMQSDIQQMDAIIGQFLEYAKPADAETFTTSVNMTMLLSEAIREAERRPDINITSQLEKNIHVMGNATELRRVINNLFENAHRYGRTKTSGICEVNALCFLKNGQVIIEISDQGNGVPEEDMERLLRPFTRLDTARGQANGAGLGLAIVDRVIKRHSGTLELSNRKTGGLIVRIILPPAGKT
jgi:two-component system, OmpR family, osmolarity sensor histidine kinase EnvZ